jgi:sortase A
VTAVRPSDRTDITDHPAWLPADLEQLTESHTEKRADEPQQQQPQPLLQPQARRSVLMKTGRAFTALGLVAVMFIGYEFVLTGLVHDRSQPALLATFKQQIVTTTLDSSSSTVLEGSPVALVTAPRIGLDQVVVEGTTPTDLQAGPGHLRASPMPGEFGNAVIAGRRTTYGGPFRDLDRLASGDRIAVTTGQGSFVYVVSHVGSLPSGQADPLVGTRDSRLTMITSDPAFLPTGRLVVVAMLQGAPVAVATRGPVHVAAAELGLTGDPLGLVFALLWAALLGGTIWVVTRWLVARWPRSVRYMLALPVLLALAVLAFSSLDPVLPGTL